ncbi:MAG: VOC family protein [Phenylobacterium sp.]|uniref:VOC family protein n=1 Tax=Phenylobacterium sp. TaxID=1871053 RepID=UPI0025EFF791|nr:VOC family protein [Phenylobacterium sp.]MBI1200298.1 VOC family protein [Phenylobacterium sp.]
MTPFVTCLWFDREAEEAANFYASIFPNSKVGRVTPYPADAPGGQAGQTMTVEFELNGQRFVGLNGGPLFKFNEAISIQVPCESQAEIDRLWAALTADGGEESVCGWCKDRFGLSWQVAPAIMPDLLSGPRAAEVMAAFMQMRKFDLAAVEAAAAS